jgi:hypothetical protein
MFLDFTYLYIHSLVGPEEVAARKDDEARTQRGPGDMVDNETVHGSCLELFELIWTNSALSSRI